MTGWCGKGAEVHQVGVDSNPQCQREGLRGPHVGQRGAEVSVRVLVFAA